MGRSRGGGGGFGRRAAPAPRRAAPARNPPAPAPSQVPAAPAQQSGGMLSGIGSTIAQGMAFGTGSAIAHRAVGAVAGSMGGGGEEAQQAPEYAAGAMDAQQQQPMQNAVTGACAQDKTMFYECLQHNKGDQQACHFLYEQLQQCQQSQNSMQFS